MVRGAARRAYLKVQLALREVVALSPRTMGAIASNTVRMAALEARWRHARRGDGPEVDGGSYTGASAMPGGGGIAATFTRATLHVTALSDDLVRIAWGPGRDPYDVATRGASLASPSEVRVEISGEGGASLSTPLLRVVVDDAGATVFGADGALRYAELTPLVRGSRRVLRRVLRPGERLCGLGEQAGRLDLTGATFRMWNRDPGGSWGAGQSPLYCSIPVTVGLHASGPVWAFHENTHEARVTVGAVTHADHGVTAEFEDGALVTYVAVGELDDVLTTATTLIGRPAMPPRWALGYHHCRWGWRTDAVVTSVLDGFASRGIPVSALHLDIDHMDSFRVFTFDEQRFGGVEALCTRAGSHGARLVAIVDPAVRRDPSFELYRDGMRDGHFVTDAAGEVDHGTVWPGWAAFPDFTRRETRVWWGSHYSRLVERGISGVWHDMNEPTSITLWGDRTLPRSDRFDLDGRGGDHAEAHAVYGLLMDRAGHDALVAARGGSRPFLVSRSGWAGLAAVAWHWTADVESSVEGLAQQVPTFLGLGLSGVPFTGSDIGGFSGIPSPQLYIRWLELGVVSPFCRTHCVIGAPDREPWSFEAGIESAISRLVKVRYRLLPHLYRLADDAHRLGHPLWRPVDWPLDGRPSGASARSDAVLLGDELLVVPVADPSARSVVTTLPEGRWRRLRLCAPLEAAPGEESDVVGAAPVTLDAPLGQPVMLQRAGTIVVLDDAWLDEHATLDLAHTTGRWALHVCLDDAGRATGRGFEDAGDGAGPDRADAYEAVSDGDSLVVTWTSSGEYVRNGPTSVVVHGRRYATGAADGAAVAVSVADASSHVSLAGPFSRLVLR